MKKNNMILPQDSRLLSLEEMMNNESGWYVNFKTGELFITYRDIDSTIRWVSSFVENLNAELDTTDVTTKVTRTVTKGTGLGDVKGGFGFRYNENGFKVFALSEEELKLANSNSLIF